MSTFQHQFVIISRKRPHPDIWQTRAPQRNCLQLNLNGLKSFLSSLPSFNPAWPGWGWIEGEPNIKSLIIIPKLSLNQNFSNKVGKQWRLIRYNIGPLCQYTTYSDISLIQSAEIESCLSVSRACVLYEVTQCVLGCVGSGNFLIQNTLEIFNFNIWRLSNLHCNRKISNMTLQFYLDFLFWRFSTHESRLINLKANVIIIKVSKVYFGFNLNNWRSLEQSRNGSEGAFTATQ